MRRFLPFLMAAALPAAPALAGGLEKHPQDLNFSFGYTDSDEIGETLDVSGRWTYVVEGGHFEIGAVAAYVHIDLEDNTKTNSLALGPAVVYNFTPDNPVTGFLSGYFAQLGGDAGDIFDYELQIAAGIRGFVGDSASVDLALSRTRDVGAEFFGDVDTTVVTAGLSIFFGAR